MPLLGRLPWVPGWVIADRGYTSHAFCSPIPDLSAQPAFLTQCHEAPVARPERIYVHRNKVGRLWARLKGWRVIATRYEKTARFFMGVLWLEAALAWLMD